MPDWIVKELKPFLEQVTYPLSVRSSSLLEDAQFQPYAGLYHTYMIPNNDPDLSVRLKNLLTAIKLVYASTYYEGPAAFTRKIAGQPQEEAMAVIIQQLSGSAHGEYFYPAISGVAQSLNYYPVSKMKYNDGIVHIALGLGKAVMEGERALRFSPKYPQILPQFSTVDDILLNAQRYFYALKVKNYLEDLHFGKDFNLEKIEIDDAEGDFPIRTLASTYSPEDHRIRDSGTLPGPKILTFARVLKHNLFPLPELLSYLLERCRKSMGCPVEIEFSVNLNPDEKEKNEFSFLQMRPMPAGQGRFDVKISDRDRAKAFCYSSQALGNGINKEIEDIVYVKPDDFKPEATQEMAIEIDGINASLLKENKPYLLIGPGRWGSADRWLGIPVRWQHICGVGAIIELRNEKLKADPSQGSHFFQNITSLGIQYLTVTEDAGNFFNWTRLESIPTVQETPFMRHIRLNRPMTLKIDGVTSQGVILMD